MMNELLTKFAASTCHNGSFFAFPTWYKYIQDSNDCSSIKVTNINDIWLIVAAVVEILLRVAALVAIGFIIYGGIQYVISQGEPDKTAKAQSTIINALVGLVIATLAALIINFIARSIT